MVWGRRCCIVYHNINHRMKRKDFFCKEERTDKNKYTAGRIKLYLNHAFNPKLAIMSVSMYVCVSFCVDKHCNVFKYSKSLMKNGLSIRLVDVANIIIMMKVSQCVRSTLLISYATIVRKIGQICCI